MYRFLSKDPVPPSQTLQLGDASPSLLLDETLTRLLDLTQDVLDIPMALIWFFDASRTPRLKAARGIAQDLLPYASPFCAALATANDLLEIHNVETHPTMADDALLASADARYGAGIPLRLADHVIGGFVILDTHPRSLSKEQRRNLQRLAHLAVDAWALSEQGFAEREARYRAYFEKSTEGIWCYELTPPVSTSLPTKEFIKLAYERARLTECNDAMARMYGYENAAQLASDDLNRRLPPHTTGNFEAVKAFIEGGFKAKEVETIEYDRYNNPRYFLNNIVGIIEDGYLVRVWGAQADITERRQAEEALRKSEQSLIEARNQALELARMKSAFLANMSHEIRTPLTAMVGFADILADEADAAHRELAQLIRQSGQSLIQTLKSVLDLSRLEGEALELHTERFDVAVLARQVLDLFRLEAEHCNVDLSLVAPDAPLIVWLDAGAVNRILTNLVSNAMKFTSAGHVTVALQIRDDILEMRVEDTGLGIGKDFLPRLFSEFRQEAGSLAPHERGSGLGLAITKRLVTVLDGSIDVESEKGKGSIFTVCLPLKHAATTDEP